MQHDYGALMAVLYPKTVGKLLAVADQSVLNLKPEEWPKEVAMSCQVNGCNFAPFAVAFMEELASTISSTPLTINRRGSIITSTVAGVGVLRNTLT